MELDELKKQYEKIAKKYKLPGFKEMNEIFEIEKISSESDTLLRNVRKVMLEKVISSLGFVDMLMNPMQAPRMYHSYIKAMSVEDRERIEKIYNAFSELSVASLERELDYDEKLEGEMIKKIFQTWKDVKPHFKSILGNVLKPSSQSKKKERSYFG